MKEQIFALKIFIKYLGICEILEAIIEKINFDYFLFIKDLQENDKKYEKLEEINNCSEFCFKLLDGSFKSSYIKRNWMKFNTFLFYLK